MKFLWLGVSGLVFLSCFPFTNPLDPLSSEYIGFPSSDRDGDGIGSYRDADDFHLISPEQDTVIIENQVTLKCSVFDPSYNSRYHFQVSTSYQELIKGSFVYEAELESPAYEIGDLLDLHLGKTLYWRARGFADTEWSEWTDALKVFVRKQLAGTFTYTPILRAVGSFPAESSPIWQGALPDQTGDYSIHPDLPIGISLEETTGKISLDSAIDELSDVTYTVSVAGSEKYFGTVTGTLRIVLHKKYEIGDTGLAGGLVFHVKPDYSDGWRYLESAPSDQSSGISWGAMSTSLGASSTDIGSGTKNTQQIVSGLSSGTYAAHLCANLALGGFQDWFLPSKEELNELYAHLYLKSLGDFSPASYWSSSEVNSDETWHQRFGDSGYQYKTNKYQLHRVRAIRAF